MKRYLMMLAVLAFSAAVVSAADAKSDAADMTLKGKLEKKEVTGSAAATKVSYELITTDYGKVELPKTDIKLDDLVGQDVEMVVKAVVKADKKHVKVSEIVSAKKVEAAAAKTDAPAAPAAPATPAK